MPPAISQTASPPVLWLRLPLGRRLRSVKIDISTTQFEKNNELSSINQEITIKKDKKSNLEKERDSIQSVIKKRQTEFDEAMEIVKNRDSILAEIKSSEEQLAIKKTDIDSLDTSIATKKEVLATVNQLIKEKEEEPISLSAGTYIIGMDVPVGRYKAVPVGRGSNFVVYDSIGSLDVNTILGGPYGESEYIFFAFGGGIIESHSTAELIPVE